MFGDSCRNRSVFSSVRLVGKWVGNAKVPALLASGRVPEYTYSYTTGGLLLVYRFPTACNILISIRSRSEDRLCGQALDPS